MESWSGLTLNYLQVGCYNNYLTMPWLYHFRVLINLWTWVFEYWRLAVWVFSETVLPNWYANLYYPMLRLRFHSRWRHCPEIARAHPVYEGQAQHLFAPYDLDIDTLLIPSCQPWRWLWSNGLLGMSNSSQPLRNLPVLASLQFIKARQNQIVSSNLHTNFWMSSTWTSCHWL